MPIVFRQNYENYNHYRYNIFFLMGTRTLHDRVHITDGQHRSVLEQISPEPKTILKWA